MTFPKLAVVGGGQMAIAMIGGLLDQQRIAIEALHIVDPDEKRHQVWRDSYPGVSIDCDAVDAIKKSEMVLLAVKPNVIGMVLGEHSTLLTEKFVVSIAAGVPSTIIEEAVGHRRIARVMPNTPAMIGQGASGFCIGEDVTSADKSHLELLLTSVGIAVEVPESQLDAVTGLSGSGPAYVFMMIEALADGGVASGLPRPLALRLATQTVLGAADMVKQSGMHPGQLKDNVCSPGGTTIAAVAELEDAGLRSAMIRAVTAATQRSRSLRDQ
ncbi:MAG: pyrroline-5-carboxylate reductase [Planctomycetota bacterium]